MKIFRSLSICLVLAIGMISCQVPVDRKMLHGEWKGVQWLVEGQSASYDATSTFFSFREDGTYTYRYTDMEEMGTFYINGNELFTTPDGGIKMMVVLDKLTADSLVMNMNRGGTSETLTLVR